MHPLIIPISDRKSNIGAKLFGRLLLTVLYFTLLLWTSDSSFATLSVFYEVQWEDFLSPPC